jgi:hypothetical protein
MQLSINPQEREDLVRGLQMRICMIETGDAVLRANDAINMGQPKLVKALSGEQRELVARLEGLVDRLQKGR